LIDYLQLLLGKAVILPQVVHGLAWGRQGGRRKVEKKEEEEERKKRGRKKTKKTKQKGGIEVGVKKEREREIRGGESGEREGGEEGEEERWRRKEKWRNGVKGGGKKEQRRFPPRP